MNAADFTVETIRLVSEPVTVVRVSHPTYGAAEQWVADAVTRQARFDIVDYTSRHLMKCLMQGVREHPPVSRRQTLSEILQEARVRP